MGMLLGLDKILGQKRGRWGGGTKEEAKTWKPVLVNCASEVPKASHATAI